MPRYNKDNKKERKGKKKMMIMSDEDDDELMKELQAYKESMIERRKRKKLERLKRLKEKREKKISNATFRRVRSMIKEEMERRRKERIRLEKEKEVKKKELEERERLRLLENEEKYRERKRLEMLKLEKEEEQRRKKLELEESIKYAKEIEEKQKKIRGLIDKEIKQKGKPLLSEDEIQTSMTIALSCSDFMIGDNDIEDVFSDPGTPDFTKDPPSYFDSYFEDSNSSNEWGMSLNDIETVKIDDSIDNIDISHDLNQIFQ